MGKAKMVASTGIGSSANGHETRFILLESRLAAAERTLELLRQSRLGGELRALELARKQRVLDRDADQGREQKRAGAADDRATVFGRFAHERLAVHVDLEVTVRELLNQYNGWALDNSVPRLHRFESDAELQDAMAKVYASEPCVETADVPQPGYMGRHVPNVPGYVGIALAAEDADPAEAATALNTEADHAERERRARREDHRLAASVEDAVIDTRRTRDEAARVAVEAAQK